MKFKSIIAIVLSMTVLTLYTVGVNTNRAIASEDTEVTIDDTETIEEKEVEEYATVPEKTGDKGSISDSELDIVESVSGTAIQIDNTAESTTGSAIEYEPSKEPIPDIIDYSTGIFYSYFDREEAERAIQAFFARNFSPLVQVIKPSMMLLSGESQPHSHTEDCYVGHRHTDTCYEVILNTATYYSSPNQKYALRFVGDITLDRYRRVNTTELYCPTCSTTIGSFYEEWNTYYSDMATLTARFEFEYVKSPSQSYGPVYFGVKYANYSSTYVDSTWSYVLAPDNNYYYMKENPSYKYYKDLIVELAYRQTSNEQLIRTAMKFGFIPNIACRNCYFGGKITGIPATVTYGQQYAFCTTPQDETAMCNSVVTNISPEFQNQTIYIDNPINKNILLNKLDGTNETILGESNFIANTLGDGQTATISYSGLIGNARTNSTLSTTVAVNVIPSLSSITVEPSSEVVYNGETPTYKVIANYLNGTTKLLDSSQYILSGWTESYGTKNITITYTEGGKTVSSDVVISVLPNVTSLRLIVDSDEVLYGKIPTIKGVATYEDNSTNEVDVLITSIFNPTILGIQTVFASYTENGVEVSGNCNIEVKDYPIEISVNLVNDYIYQSQNVLVNSSVITLASGAIYEDVNLTEGSYNNTDVGTVEVKYTYSLNGVEVSCYKFIEIKADLVDIVFNSDTFTIYKEQNLPIQVSAVTNTKGNILLDSTEFEIIDFDNTIYNRNSKKYLVSCTYKNVTKTKEITVIVLPNVTDISIESTKETVENEFVKFVLTVTYEDGIKREVTTLGEGLTIINYTPDKVGYQDITFVYTEGGKTLTVTKQIRVRALINISIPTSMVIEIEPNRGELLASSLKFINNSKESVRIFIEEVIIADDTELIDVMPDEFSNWISLGIKDSKKIAVGLYYSTEPWLKESLVKPLYVKEITRSKEIGVIGAMATSSLRIIANYGTAFNTNKNFKYNIKWSIKLAEV